MTEEVEGHKSNMEFLRDSLREVIEVLDNQRVSEGVKLQVKLNKIGRLSFSWYEEAKDFVSEHFPNVCNSLDLPFLPKSGEVKSLSREEIEDLVSSLSRRQLGDWFMNCGDIIRYLEQLK